MMMQWCRLHPARERLTINAVIGISGPINSARSGPRYGTMLSSHPHPRPVGIALASAALTNSIRGSAFIGSPVFPRAMAFIVIGSGVSLAISGRSTIQLLAILIPTAPEPFILGLHDRLFEIFLAKGPHQESGDSRVSSGHFLDRDAYLGRLACSRELARR